MNLVSKLDKFNIWSIQKIESTDKFLWANILYDKQGCANSLKIRTYKNYFLSIFSPWQFIWTWLSVHLFLSYYKWSHMMQRSQRIFDVFFIYFTILNGRSGLRGQLANKYLLTFFLDPPGGEKSGDRYLFKYFQISTVRTRVF